MDLTDCCEERISCNVASNKEGEFFMRKSMDYSSQLCQDAGFAQRNKGRLPLRNIVIMRRYPSTDGVLIHNLRALMSARRQSSRDLAKHSGVSDRMIGKILNGESQPTTTTIDKLAAALGVRSWQLLLPGITPDILDSGGLNKIHNAYLRTDAAGRGVMESQAEYLSRHTETEQ